MQINNERECRAYAEAEIAAALGSRPGWHSERPTEPSAPPLSWDISNDKGWYTLEARLNDQEFLIWFGNRRVGVLGLHWIIHPAVHLAFADLLPRNDPVAIKVRLSDVLSGMIETLDGPRVFATRFELNTFSFT